MSAKANPPEPREVVSEVEMQSTDNSVKSSSRRNFIGRIGGAAAAAWTASAVGLAPLIKTSSTQARAAAKLPSNLAVLPDARRAQQLALRTNLAQQRYNKPIPQQKNNGDEQLYNTYIGQYSKALKHTSIGDPDPVSYRRLVAATQTGRQQDFEAVPLGGDVPLTSPQAGLAVPLIGGDEVSTTIPPAPPFASAERAGEMVENYWMALCRDVPFTNYGNEPLTQAAIADLNKLSDFTGPKVNGQVTAGTLFRGFTASDLVGPYTSQFFVLPIGFGLGNLAINGASGTPAQQYLAYQPGLDYNTDTASWLRVQNGQATDTTRARSVFYAFGSNEFLPGSFYLYNGRMLSGLVHVDELYQHPFWAVSEMLAGGFPASVGNPYSATKTPNETAFATWGGPMFSGLLGNVALAAAWAVWYQKWYVHRPLRPEEFSGRVHNQLAGLNNYPINADVLGSDAVNRVFSQYGTYYLPMAYPEGAPTHPSYGSGHATVAGACITLLKALFNEDQTFLDIGIPPVYSPDGVQLLNYTGQDVEQITVRTELDKMASNIGLGRDLAGVHWRSDYRQSLYLGEQVTLNFLRELVDTFNEDGGYFQFHTFDGNQVTIAKGTN